MNTKETLWTKDFISITLINFFIFLSFQMIVATLPLYVENIGGTESIIGWITGLATIAAFIARPIAGVALDKIGRRMVFVVGHIVLIVTTYLFGNFNLIWLILILRFINGIGWGIGSTASITVASDTIPINRFGEGIGLFNLSNGLGMALGPLIGLSILNAFDFKNVVRFGAILGIIALILSQFIRYRKIEKPIESEEGKRSLLPFEKEALGPSLIIGIITITYGAVIAFIPLYGIEEGVINIGLFFTIYAIFLMFTRPIAGKMIDKKGFNIFIYSGLAILVLALLVVSQASSLPIFILAAVLYGIGFGLLESSLLTMAIKFTPEEKTGGANATFFACFDGGIGVGSIIAGMIAARLGYSMMYLLQIIPIVLAFILFQFVRKQKTLV